MCAAERDYPADTPPPPPSSEAAPPVWRAMNKCFNPLSVPQIRTTLRGRRRRCVSSAAAPLAWQLRRCISWRPRSTPPCSRSAFDMATFSSPLATICDGDAPRPACFLLASADEASRAWSWRQCQCACLERVQGTSHPNDMLGKPTGSDCRAPACLLEPHAGVCNDGGQPPDSRPLFVPSLGSDNVDLVNLDKLGTLVQAYAMTEASHQMTSNPLPKHGLHKPSSVGRAQGSVKVNS